VGLPSSWASQAGRSERGFAPPPPGWAGYTRRVDAGMLAEVGPDPAEQRPRVYVCGPTPFAEAVAEALVGLGHQPQHIKTERFGPTES
jgi:ferredoxin-NADP reductase